MKIRVELDPQVAGYTRLRVGSYRVVVRFYAESGQRVARCVFAEKRGIVYELFAEIVQAQSG